MKPLIARLTLAAFLASTALAQAQHAVPRGGGSSGSGSGSGSGSSGGSSGVSSGGSSRGGGDSDGSRAVPRHPPSTSSGGGKTTASGKGRGSGSGGGVDRSPSSGTSVSSRPQGDNPTTGYAVPRARVAQPIYPGGGYHYYPPAYGWYYNPWGWGTWGLGYVWDPFWYGGGFGWGYPAYGGGAYGGGYGGGYAGDYSRDDDVGEGALRIKVKPREARVIVDGAVHGTVDDYDGNFQKLPLSEGAHNVRLDLDGYEPLAFDVMIVDGQTVTYKGKLSRR